MPFRALLKADRRLLVIACIGVALALQVYALAHDRPLASHEQHVIDIAATLLDHGVYADGFVANTTPTPGRSIAPGYPAVIAALARLDGRLATGIRCLAAERAACRMHGPLLSLIVLQALMGITALGLAHFIAHRLSGSAEIAGLATLLLFVMGDFGKFARLVMPQLLVMVLAVAFCALLLVARTRRSMLAFAIGGVTAGILGLVDVYYAALALLAPIALIVGERWREQPDFRHAAAGAAMLAIGAVGVLGPWMGRNVLLFGDAALTQGPETVLLAQRFAYNALSGGELLAGVVCWIPGIGEALSGLVVPAETARKFGLYYPGSLLHEGERILAAARAAGADRDPFWWLLQTHALGDPLRYAASSLLLAWRGLSASDSLLVVWGVMVVPRLLSRLSAARGLAPFLLVAGPFAGLVVVQALLTPNLPWMNLPILFIYALAIAESAGGLELPIGIRRLFSGSNSAGVASPDGAGVPTFAKPVARILLPVPKTVARASNGEAACRARKR